MNKHLAKIASAAAPLATDLAIAAIPVLVGAAATSAVAAAGPEVAAGVLIGFGVLTVVGMVMGDDEQAEAVAA